MASKASVLGVQAVTLILQVAAVVAMATPTSLRQRCDVRCEGQKAGRVSHLNESKETRMRANSAQYAVDGKMRKTVTKNFEIFTKVILNFQQALF